MEYETLYVKTVAELRQMARDMGVKTSARTKAALIDTLLEAQKTQKPQKSQKTQKTQPADEQSHEVQEAQKAPRGRGRPRKSPAAEQARPEEAPKLAEPNPDAKPASDAKPETESKPAPEAGPEPITAERPEAVPAVSSETKPEAESKPTAPSPARNAQPRQRAAFARGERRTASQGQDAQARSHVAKCPANAQPARDAARGNRDRSDGRAQQRPQMAAPAAQERARVRSAAAVTENVAPQNRDENRRPAAPQEEPRARRDYTETAPDGTPIGDFTPGSGLLEIQSEGYGFLRAENCLPGKNDTYLSIAQIRRFNLRMGDFIEGLTRPQREGDRYSAMVYINRINGEPPEKALARKPFETLVPLYPNERLRLESPKHGEMALRLIDLLAPIGKGQRGMIVSPPKAGKTTLLKQIANAISDNNPECKLIVLLIDERPEEVTDMKRSIQGEVVYSTFDENPDNHARVSEMVLEHAQRMVEAGRDVVILLDSITRLARAYNLIIPPTGRSLSGGLDPGALYKPKRFFGAARNIENGGSLTIIATALVDTGSRMDDIIFEEFKGTGNMELHLDRKLADKRVFPAIDLVRSGTRREELLLTPKELEGAYAARRMLSGGNTQQNAETLIGLMSKTAGNDDFLNRIKGWLSVYEKEGFSMGGKL